MTKVLFGIILTLLIGLGLVFGGYRQAREEALQAAQEARLYQGSLEDEKAAHAADTASLQARLERAEALNRQREEEIRELRAVLEANPEWARSRLPPDVVCWVLRLSNREACDPSRSPTPTVPRPGTRINGPARRPDDLLGGPG